MKTIFGALLALYVCMAFNSLVKAEEVCLEGRYSDVTYCYDCETNTQDYWCSKQVPQPHTCCKDPSQIEVADSANGDSFFSVFGTAPGTGNVIVDTGQGVRFTVWPGHTLLNRFDIGRKANSITMLVLLRWS